LRLFAGYSGWGPAQLDGEIAAGHWFVVDALRDDAFDDEPETLWRRVLERDPQHREWVRNFPDDPTLN
jgi:putative transcriptional regulator